VHLLRLRDPPPVDIPFSFFSSLSLSFELLGWLFSYIMFASTKAFRF